MGFLEVSLYSDRSTGLKATQALRAYVAFRCFRRCHVSLRVNRRMQPAGKSQAWRPECAETSSMLLSTGVGRSAVDRWDPDPHPSRASR